VTAFLSVPTDHPAAAPPAADLPAAGDADAPPALRTVERAGPPPAAASAPAPAGLTMFELARLEEARRAAADVQAAVRASAGEVPPAAGAGWSRAWRLARTGGLAVVAAGAAYAYANKADRAFATSVAPRAVIASAADSTPGGVAGAGAMAGAGAVPVRLPVRPAFGRSEGVYVRIALPGQVVQFPVALASPSAQVRYHWVRAGDGSPAVAERPLTGSVVVAPTRPGIYHLALASGPTGPGAARRVLDDVSLAVLVPFAEKLGATLNGYRIGRYPFETFGGERPVGFIEVTPTTARLPISRHLRLEDFLTHDNQLMWPRYVAVSPELLDKVELVAAEIARTRGIPDPVRVRVDVHSGFRTPLHNGNVEGSAFNSRHQYGDAADVAFDADGDGRFSALDAQWAGLATEMIERRHPELVGGLGMYTSARAPYVHIDVRGRRARWWKR
jgi:uncharacterized protein YcbK (DUF882 family)